MRRDAPRSPEKISFSGRETDRLRAFTAELTAAATKTKVSAAPAVDERKRGCVKRFSDIRGFGFIVVDDGREIFVHYTGIKGDGYRTLSAGEIVEFVISDSRGRPFADQVEVVPKGLD